MAANEYFNRRMQVSPKRSLQETSSEEELKVDVEVNPQMGEDHDDGY